MATTTPARTTTAVSVHGLRRVFGERAVLDGLDLEVSSSEFVCVLGPSGCGKTTLLRLLAGLDAPDGGTLDAPAEVAVVFQEPRLLPWRDVRFNVAFALADRKVKDAGRRVEAALREVGLEGHATAWPATLSGGQAQRVALARALVQAPRLLLLDEPFAALDALTRLKMQDLVRELCASHQPATVMVTHDVHEAILLGDRVLVMRDGRFRRDATTSAFGTAERNTTRFAELRRSLLAELVSRLQAVSAQADDVEAAVAWAYDRGEGLTERERGEVAGLVHALKVTATQASLEATSRVFDVTGARATAARYGFDRHWRNVRTHSLHDPIAYKINEVGRLFVTGEVVEPSPYR